MDPNEETSRLKEQVDCLQGQLTFYAMQTAKLMAATSTRSYTVEDVFKLSMN